MLDARSRFAICLAELAKRLFGSDDRDADDPVSRHLERGFAPPEAPNVVAGAAATNGEAAPEPVDVAKPGFLARLQENDCARQAQTQIPDFGSSRK